MRFKNTSGDTQTLPTLDLVVPDGGEFEATGEDAKNLLASGLYERTDKPKTSEKE